MGGRGIDGIEWLNSKRMQDSDQKDQHDHYSLSYGLFVLVSLLRTSIVAVLFKRSVPAQSTNTR
jgi:hypothetical protein